MYRIRRITNIFSGLQPVNYGLSIEKKVEDTDSWYVIAFVKYDEKNEDCNIESVGTRLLDVEYDYWPYVKSLINTAIDAVVNANKYGGYYEESFKE